MQEINDEYKVYNFSAGPSILPEYVLKKAQSELINYKSTGQSVMEMSHRSKEFQEIIYECETLLRRVMSIPENYNVLFLQGGASTQFAMVPLNLMTKNHCADFILSGNWSKKAYQEASKFGKANVIATSEDDNFTYIPKINKLNFSKNADYLHFCYNNTIYGTRFHEIPDCGSIPLVSDVSSFIASEPLDISKFSLLYAGAQKNLGIAGVTIVIIKKELLKNELPSTPTMLSYKIHASKKSMFNTPPCFAIYICKLMLEWIQNEIGGLEKIKELNSLKSRLLYDYIDNSKLFKSPVNIEDRSNMNIVFSTGNTSLDEKFINFSEQNNIINIKGHRKVGGMRASLYNAMPLEGVKKLINVMEKFEGGIKL